jgi:hypothetical protein
VALSSRTEQGARWVTLAAQTKGGRTARTASDVQFVDDANNNIAGMAGVLASTDTVRELPILHVRVGALEECGWSASGWSVATADATDLLRARAADGSGDRGFRSVPID